MEQAMGTKIENSVSYNTRRWCCERSGQRVHASHGSGPGKPRCWRCITAASVGV